MTARSQSSAHHQPPSARNNTPSPARSSSTARSLPATAAATTPATALDERRRPLPTIDPEFERDPWRWYEERQRLHEQRSPRLEPPMHTWDAPSTPPPRTIAALFLRDPHYVF